MKKKTLKQTLSMIVVLTLLLGILPVNAWAVDHVHDAACGYSEPSECTHAHDGACGYVAEVLGVACGHSHDDACGYSEGSAGTPCGHVHGDCGYAEAIPGTPCTHDCASGGCTPNEDGVTYTCAHIHGDCGYSEGTPASACSHTQHTDCGYVPEVPGTACNHSHDGSCGYVEAVSGNPCTHTHDAACGYSEGAACNYAVVPANEHTHVWSTEWSGNNSYHWHECIADGCDLTHGWGDGKGDYAKHEFDITSDTHSRIDNLGFGHHFGTCKICGRSDSMIIIAATRKSDETYHWYECPCGVIGWDEFRDKVEHSFDDDADMICDTCGYERTIGGGTTVNGIITLTPADLVNGANGEGWSFDGSILTIESGYRLNFEGKCEFNVDNYGTISGGTFSGNVDNDGTISGGTFNSNVKNDGTISGGTFGNNVTNQGTITNGIFSGGVLNNDTISGGTFSGFVVNNTVYAVISNGTFSGNVTNYGTISGGTFSGDIDNYAYIEGGSFRCDIDGIADIPGVTLIHSPGTEWESDGTNHWHECSCGAKSGEAAHSGGTATCTEKAKCTACGTEYGNLAEHTYGTDWKSDGTNHWHECSCGAKADNAAHSGGTATCTEKAVCTNCGTAYGEVKPDAHDWGNWLSNNDGTHTRTCANDENHTETDDCSGGTATCTEKAKCTVCATEYGNLAAHSYGTEWKSDGTNHWHECACSAKKDAAAHSGGEATCAEKAKCSICGSSYGEKDSDNHSFAKYVSDRNATCKKNGTETAKCDHGCGKTHTRTDWGSKLGHNFVNGVCTRCKVSQWNPDTGDKIMIAVTVLALSGAALLLLLVFRKKQRR